MEIPLLLAVNPRVANPSVWVPVGFDHWQVRVEGLDDSELILHSNESSFTDISISNGQVFDGPIQVKVKIEKRGTEKTISVFAVRCK